MVMVNEIALEWNSWGEKGSSTYYFLLEYYFSWTEEEYSDLPS